MRRNKRSSHPLSSYLLFLIVGAIFLLSLLGRPAESWAPAITNHQTSVSPLWTRQNVYIGKYDQAQMVAVGNKLLLIGSEAANKAFRLIALDGNTGDTIWQYGNTSENVLTASSSILFVGEVGRVIAVNPNNGKIVWSTNLPFTRSVTKLLIRNNTLHVDTVSENHFLLNSETGEILQSISYTINDASNVDIPNLSNHKMNLEFVENISYFQKQIGWPNAKEVEIVATDETGGNQLWSLTLPMVGRAAISPLGIFALEVDGTLLRLDPNSGTHNELIQFDSALTRRYFYPEGTAQDYGYFVAVDSANQVIYIYLGDSRQLFAFKLPITG